MAWLDGALGHGSDHYGPWRRSCGVVGEAFQVLDGGGQQELVVSATQAPQSEPDHREDMLGLAEEPLELLPVASGMFISIGFHQGLSIVTGFLVDIP